jgi:predicted PurR-regulated permease PerM
VIVFGLPALAAQITILVGNVPGYISGMQGWLVAQNLDAGQTDLVNSLSNALLGGLQATASGLLLTGLSLLNLISMIFITPIVAIYMLNDWDRMVARVNQLLPDEQAKTVRFLAREIDDTLGGFARGQSLVCLALGTIYALGLWVIGLEGAVIVGLLAGLVSFVPYVGAAFGMILAGGLGLGQFGFDWWPFVQMAMVFGFGQFIEGNFLTPRLVGDRVKLHPVWIIFALLAMGALFGFLGLLLAVPIAAIIGVLVRHAVTLYKRDYVKRVDD